MAGGRAAGHLLPTQAPPGAGCRGLMRLNASCPMSRANSCSAVIERVGGSPPGLHATRDLLQMSIHAHVQCAPSCQAVRMTGSAQSRHPAKRFGGLAQWGVVVAAAALVVAFPVATWWLVGDQSTVHVGADADYAFEPFDVSVGVERAAGIGSTALVVVALLVLVWATRRHRLDVRWWMVLIPLLAAGLIVGFGWRVMTAGVIGANIGAGFAVLLGGPAVAVLLIWAAGYSIRLLHRRRTEELARSHMVAYR